MQALDIVSYVILCSLAAFVWLEYVIGSWRLFAKSERRLLLTFLVGLYWIAHGTLFLSFVPALKIINIPFVVSALFLPPTLVLIALLTSPAARDTADRISLRWTISTLEGAARIIVGTLFIVWYFMNRLPPIFAWVAGPGDIISGIAAFIAVAQLEPVAEYFEIERRHWSTSDIINSGPSVVAPEDVPKLIKRLNIALILVIVGILDFFAAPISAGISLGLGNPARAMSSRPMGFVPMFLVPSVFAMEVVAVRQLIVVKRYIRSARKLPDVEQELE